MSFSVVRGESDLLVPQMPKGPKLTKVDSQVVLRDMEGQDAHSKKIKMERGEVM